MKPFFELIRRNLKVFFNDKGMFISSLITPIILLVLYATFLANVYKESFLSALPEGLNIDPKLINATVTGQLIASLLAVSCVTVSFCANLLMITDKANGTINDLTVSPIKKPLISLSYYFASSFSTLIITFTATAVCLVYLATQGWYLSGLDIVSLIVNVFLLTLFGTAFSSCLHFFLKTNGQASAVGTIVSAGYGFICGAYMPISSFSEGLQKVLSFLPGTYGTALIKNTMLRGVFEEMAKLGFPSEVISGIKSSIDCNLSFFGHDVSIFAMYMILIASVVILTVIFVLFTLSRKTK